MSEIGKLLGQRVRELRTQRAERLTQEELARRAGISVSFLSMIERGERVAHLKTFAALADALDVLLAELFSGVDQEPSSASDLARPLSNFCRSRRLSSRDIERLLGMARAMFNEKPDRKGRDFAPRHLQPNPEGAYRCTDRKST
jgi:DNA-binding XRE family transcriptional regulator